MRVKHYKLLASVAMLISLLVLPMSNVAKVINSQPVTEVIREDVKPVGSEITELMMSTTNVRTRLDNVYDIDPNKIDWWAIHIATAAMRYDVPEKYLISILAVESNFNQYPKRKNGLVGPAQIKAKYWKNNGRYNIYKPDENIYLGAKILRSYKDKCGNWECAIKSYNVGLGAHLRGQSKQQQRKYYALVSRQLSLIEKDKMRG